MHWHGDSMATATKEYVVQRDIVIGPDNHPRGSVIQLDPSKDSALIETLLEQGKIAEPSKTGNKLSGSSGTGSTSSGNKTSAKDD